MRLLSWLLRCAGLLLLAAGTVLAVGDIARSVASSRTELMTVGEARALAGSLRPAAGAPPASLDPRSAGVFATDGRGARLSAVLDTQPASVVLGLGGAVLLLLGRRPRRPGRPGLRP